MNLLKKEFLNNVSLLNILLLSIAVFLFFELDYPLINKKIKITIPKPKEVLVQGEEKAAAESSATYLDYSAVTEKNLFHPERKLSTDKKEDQAVARPEIILYGTLITGEKRIAYIEDKKSPYSTPGRGKRQVAVNEGEMIAGYKLTEVNAESILLVRGEDKMVVALNTQKDRKPGETTGKPIMPSSLPSSTAGQVIPSLQPQTNPTHPPPPATLPPSPTRPMPRRGVNVR
jgi:hypothetical protein